MAIPKTSAQRSAAIFTAAPEPERVATEASRTEPELSTLPRVGPVTERNFRQAKTLFSELFKRHAPFLELRDRASKLSDAELEPILRQFARTAGLHFPSEVYIERARIAERHAIGATSIPEKTEWLKLAFDGWITAARFDAPVGARGSQKEAQRTAELISSISGRKGHRLFWDATAAMLSGQPEQAASMLSTARRHVLDEDIREVATELAANIKAMAPTIEIETLIHRMTRRPVETTGLRRAIEEARRLADAHPSNALRLAVVTVEAERRLAKLTGGNYTPAQAIAALDSGFAKASAALSAKSQFGPLGRLAVEHHLLRAKNLLIAKDLDAADEALGHVFASGTSDQVYEASLLTVEALMSRGRVGEAVDALATLFDSTPGLERKAFVAGLMACVSPDEPQRAIRLIDTLIDQLRRRGTAANYSSGGHTIVTARIETGAKPLDVPKTTLTRDEAFALSDLIAMKAMLSTRNGDPHAALELIDSVKTDGPMPGRVRLARGLARLVAGDDKNGKADLKRLAATQPIDHPILSERPQTKSHHEAALDVIDELLEEGRRSYLTAAAVYPLASASDVPAAWLFERELRGRDSWGVSTMGNYEAHIAMSTTAALGFARGTEDPTCAALRKLNADGAGELAGMITSLVTKRVFDNPTIEKIPAVLGREAVQSAFENLGLGPSLSPELEHAAQNVAMACAHPGFVAQASDFLDRHGAAMNIAHNVAPTAATMLEDLDTLTAAASLNRSKKAQRAKDGTGALRAAWQDVSGAIKTKDLTSLPTHAEATAAIRALGFNPIPGQPKLLEREGATVRLVAMNVGEAEGYTIEVGTGRTEESFKRFIRNVSIDGLTFEGKHWRYFEKGYERTLRRYGNAMRRTVGLERAWRSDMKGVRALIGLGREFGLGTPSTDGKLASKKFEMGMDLHRLARSAGEILAELQAQGRAPKGVMIMVDGIDAASKTSNGERLMSIFEKAGYEGSWKSFKAPTKAERKQHWLKRYDEHRPNVGEVFMCDRSPLGDYAYNRNLTKVDLERMAEDFRAWQEGMEAEGILVLNFLFYPGVHESKSKRKAKNAKNDVPDLWRPMFTFGKREGRALAAREMLVRAKAAHAPAEIQRGLADAAKLSPGINDLRSFHDGVLVHRRFRNFADSIETEHRWTIIPTERRHKGRKRVLEFAVERLRDLV